MDVVSVTVPAQERGKDENGKDIYQEVRLTDCLDSLLGMEALQYACPSCSKNVHALKYVYNDLFFFLFFSFGSFFYHQDKLNLHLCRKF